MWTNISHVGQCIKHNVWVSYKPHKHIMWLQRVENNNICIVYINGGSPSSHYLHEFINTACKHIHTQSDFSNLQDISRLRLSPRRQEEAPRLLLQVWITIFMPHALFVAVRRMAGVAF